MNLDPLPGKGLKNAIRGLGASQVKVGSNSSEWKRETGTVFIHWMAVSWRVESMKA